MFVIFRIVPSYAEFLIYSDTVLLSIEGCTQARVAIDGIVRRARSLRKKNH